MNRHETILADWLRLASQEQRLRAAQLAGTSVAYLYSLAGSHRKCPRADKAFLLEDAFATLHEETSGALPKITARQIAMMSDLKGL